MKKICYYLLAAFTMLSLSMACNTDEPNGPNDPDEPAPTDPSAVAEYIGIWVADEGGKDIKQIRLDDDFTGEIYLESGDEYDYDYVFTWEVKDGQLTFECQDIKTSDEEPIIFEFGCSVDEKSGKLILSEGNVTLSFTKQEIEWTGCVTTIFVGSWESDDAEEKIYMSFEPMAPFDNWGIGVVVVDNVEIPVTLEQRACAASSFHFFKANTQYLTTAVDPVIEENLLKVSILKKDRVFKPMDKWKFRTYDELIATGEWDNREPDGE